MVVDRVYEVLAKVNIEADLRMECPSGGSAVLTTRKNENMLELNCSDEVALWDVLRLSRKFGPGLSVRNLRYLRSPLLQPLTVKIKEEQLLIWRPGAYPKVSSLSMLLRWLRAR